MIVAMIRPARRDDVAVMQRIEVRAGRAFLAVGMDEVAGDEPLDAATLTAYVDDGRSWVATGPDDRPVAYVIADEVDGRGHVEQVSVDPDHRGRGLGARLVDEVGAWAGARGLDGLSLTTFVEVPWNAPYYERLGFRALSPDELGEGLRAVRAHEAALGLDRWPRTAMVRQLRR